MPAKEGVGEFQGETQDEVKGTGACRLSKNNGKLYCIVIVDWPMQQWL